jgi:DNA-directed RNA polymerase specialized sigma24 family protein
LLIDQARTKARHTRLLEGVPVDVVVLPEEPIDVVRLLRCMEKLEARERNIIKWTFWLEESAQRVAERLSTTVGNVRVMRCRALDHLSRCVGGTR